MMNNSPWGILTGIRPVKIATKLLKENKSDEDVIKYFMEKYSATEKKAKLALEIAKIEKPISESLYDNGVSLYIGIPFCPSRCLYCSFVTNGAGKNSKLIAPYIECLKQEIRYMSNILKEDGKVIETVYIGGGTPTTLSAGQLDELLDSMFKEFDLSRIKEFTVEAGRPDTIDSDKLKTIRSFGIDRISINPQSMNDEILKIAGRPHTADDIRRAFELARSCDFNFINMDIIAGLPGESLDMFKNTVREVEKLSPENTTVHTMSIKRSSRLNENIAKYNLTDDETMGNMVEFAADYIRKCGKHPYYLYRQKNMLGNLENVGYAKAGFDSLYNIYIMEEIQTIVSLGCGGVTKTVDKSTDRIERIFNVKEPKDYIERLDEMLARKDELRNSVY